MNNQELRLQIANQFCSMKDYTLEEIYDFVTGGNKTEYLPKAVNETIKDGVYFHMGNKGLEFADKLADPERIKKHCKGIAVVMGEIRFVVSLKDASEEAITLTTQEDTTGEEDYYINSYEDAVLDSDGQDNTEHLKRIGLNPQLKDGEYIPSVREMYVIYLFKKSINKALEMVGGQPLLDSWYWTSTESSSPYAWILYLNDGYLNGHTKATYTYRVRPVSAFML